MSIVRYRGTPTMNGITGAAAPATGGATTVANNTVVAVPNHCKSMFIVRPLE
jgi:hypothetical protein